VELKDIIARYKELSGGFGRPVALAAFGLGREETERIFSVFDEDYHISRFFHFSDQRAASRDPRPVTGTPQRVTAGPKAPASEEAGYTVFRINGFDHTHVSLHPEIESIL
jgi:hypothetical protein